MSFNENENENMNYNQSNMPNNNQNNMQNNNFDNNQSSLGNASYEQPDYSDFGNSEEGNYQTVNYGNSDGKKKIIMVVIIAIAIILLVVLFVALFSKGNKEIVVTGPKVLYAGDSVEFVPSVPKNASDKTIYYYYSTSDKEIAQFEYDSLTSDSPSNEIVGKTNGEVDVIVTASINGKEVGKYKSKLTVCSAFNKLSFANSSYSVGVGEEVSLNLDLGTSEKCYSELKFKSSNEKVATVTEEGVVTGLTKGTSTITVDNGSTTISTTVKVVSGSQISDVTGVKLSSSNINVYTGKSTQLYATIYPTGATNKSVTWSSSNEDIAVVSSKGKVTGISAGTAVITVTTQDGNKTASARVTVKKSTTSSGGGTGVSTVKVTGVSISPTSATIYVNKTKQLYATVKPTSASDKSVSWKTSNAAVAIVNNYGKVTAKGAGTATITVTTSDGSYKARTIITVKKVTYKVPVTGVTLNTSLVELSAGTTKRVYATVSPSTASNKAVSWSTSDSTVATVNSTGTITAKKAGNATITAKTTDGGYTAKVTVKVTNASCTGAGCGGTEEPVVEKPTTPTITASDSKSSGSWHNSSFSLSASGGGSGMTYKWSPSTPGTITSDTSGSTYTVKACNSNNVCSSTASYTVKLDTTAPSCTYSAVKTSTGGSYTINYWTTYDVKITYSCSDSGSGIATKTITTNSGSSSNSYYTFQNQGINGFTINATDNAGNSMNKIEGSVRIDRTDPYFKDGSVFSTNVGGKVKFQATGLDGLSGVDHGYLFIKNLTAGTDQVKKDLDNTSGNIWTYTFDTIKDNKYEWKIRIVDKAGNIKDSATFTKTGP